MIRGAEPLSRLPSRVGSPARVQLVVPRRANRVSITQLFPRPFCDTGTTICPWCYAPCPVNGNCSGGVFLGCIDDALQVNGPESFYCILPETEDPEAWSITRDVRAKLRHLPVMLTLERLAAEISKPPSIIARAVNFTGSH
jgi:hypothetical protein